MKSDEAIGNLKFIPVALGVATAVMFVLHYWRLPGLIADFLPLARGVVAFGVGAACFALIADFSASSTPGWLRRSGVVLLTAIVLVAFAGLYLIPHVCNYWRVSKEILAGTPEGMDLDASRLIRERGLVGYFRVVGSARTSLNPDDIPNGDGLSDFLLIIVQMLDQGLQWLCTNVLQMPIAGYVSLGVWYLMFLLISYFGYEIIRDHP